MDTPDSFNHLSASEYSWRNIFGQSEINEAMDRMDGVPVRASGSPEPATPPSYHSESSTWPPASTDYHTIWDQDLSAGEFGLGSSVDDLVDLQGNSAAASPMTGSIETDRYNYASSSDQSNPSQPTLFAQTASVSARSNVERPDAAEMIADIVPTIGDVTEQTSNSLPASLLSQLLDSASTDNSSEWGSTSAVASVASDYQHAAALSPEHTSSNPVRSRWMTVGSRPRRALSPRPRSSRFITHDRDGSLSDRRDLSRDQRLEELRDRIAAERSHDHYPTARHWTRSAAARLVSRARATRGSDTPPAAAPAIPSPPPLPRPVVRPTVQTRASLSAYFSSLRSASPLNSERHTITAGRAVALMPFFEGRTGSVTLSTFPPAAVVEELTPTTKKKISPQVRKVMGKLGMEVGEPRSSRAMTPDPCSICFELPTAANASLAYPCLHAFCDACISEWVKTKSSCPNCQSTCTKILYNLRAELDYDFKEVQNRNTLVHPAAYDGDLLQFFIHMNHHRDLSRPSSAIRASLLGSIAGLRGNPYTNRTPVREYYQVAAIFSRSFQDIPTATIQEQLLPNNFEVCRVSFRRQVYAERLTGAMNARSDTPHFQAPAEIGPQITQDSGFLSRLMPWLRREVMAVLTPEASNSQKEQLYQIILGLFRSSRTILKTSFAAQVSGFILAERIGKFWEQMVQFLQNRFAMGVWDGAMVYYNPQGVQVPPSAAGVPPAVNARSGVTLVDINMYSDDEDTVGPSSTHSFPNEDPDDSDDSVQFVGIQRRGQRQRQSAPLIVLSSDDETETISTPQTVSAQTSPLISPSAGDIPPRIRNPPNFSRFSPEIQTHFFSSSAAGALASPNYAADSPDYRDLAFVRASRRELLSPMRDDVPYSPTPDHRRESWSDDSMTSTSPASSGRDRSWDREEVQIDSMIQALAETSGREEVARSSRRRTESRPRRHHSYRDNSRERYLLSDRHRRSTARARPARPVRRLRRRERSSSRDLHETRHATLRIERPRESLRCRRESRDDPSSSSSASSHRRTRSPRETTRSALLRKRPAEVRRRAMS